LRRKLNSINESDDEDDDHDMMDCDQDCSGYRDEDEEEDFRSNRLIEGDFEREDDYEDDENRPDW
jgi:hypothetical protein